MNAEDDRLPCKRNCEICTDAPPPEKWDGPYTAFRWSPGLPEENPT